MDIVYPISYDNSSDPIQWKWPGVQPYMPLVIKIYNQTIEPLADRKQLKFDFYTQWTNPRTGYFTNEMDYRFYYKGINDQWIYTPYQMLKAHGVWATPTNRDRSVESTSKITIDLPLNVTDAQITLQYRSWIHTASRPETTDTFVFNFSNLTTFQLVDSISVSKITINSAELKFTTIPKTAGTFVSEIYPNDRGETVDIDDVDPRKVVCSGLKPNTTYQVTIYPEDDKDHGKSIIFTTEAGLQIYANNKWNQAQVYVYHNDTWNTASMYVYNNGHWLQMSTPPTSPEITASKKTTKRRTKKANKE